MPERKGRYTIDLSGRPRILGYAAAVGKKEGEGPLGEGFDAVFQDAHLGEKTWEKAESELQRLAASEDLSKALITDEELDFMFSGDLLNQCIGASYGLCGFVCQIGRAHV